MTNNEKRTPTRRCVGCRESFSKQQLLRIVKFNSNVFIDNTGKADGRGAYFCGKESCFKSIVKGRKLEKALRMQIPAEIYNSLEEFSSNMEVQ